MSETVKNDTLDVLRSTTNRVLACDSSWRVAKLKVRGE